MTMDKISIAGLKRKVNGKEVKFLGAGVVDKIPFDIIEKHLNIKHTLETSVISFNSVDMIRTMSNGEKSYARLKGLTAYIDDKGFILVSPWDDRLNVITYQF